MHVIRFPNSLVTSTDRDLIEQTLSSAFMSLLDLSISSVRLHADHPAGQPSYNVILTKAHMYVVPRRLADHKLQERKWTEVNAVNL